MKEKVEKLGNFFQYHSYAFLFCYWPNTYQQQVVTHVPRYDCRFSLFSETV